MPIVSADFLGGGGAVSLTGGCTLAGSAWNVPALAGSGGETTLEGSSWMVFVLSGSFGSACLAGVGGGGVVPTALGCILGDDFMNFSPREAGAAELYFFKSASRSS